MTKLFLLHVLKRLEKGESVKTLQLNWVRVRIKKITNEGRPDDSGG